MTDAISHEARISELEKLVRDLQAQLEALQQQVSLRSRGMLGSPSSSRR